MSSLCAPSAQSEPHGRDHILFYEYFHSENGAEQGASHLTGWTGLVAKAIRLYGVLGPKRVPVPGIAKGWRKRGWKQQQKTKRIEGIRKKRKRRKGR